jgi:hypothetical protein
MTGFAICRHKKVGNAAEKQLFHEGNLAGNSL